MRILVTGTFAFPQYEEQFCFGLRAAGAEVLELPMLTYLGGIPRLVHAQSHSPNSPGAVLANAALIRQAILSKPDMVFAWRTPWLHPTTVRRLQQSGVAVAIYNNDDPFGPDRDSPHWVAFRNLVPVADLVLAYRDLNLREYIQSGAKKVSLLRSCFDPRRDRPVPPSAELVSDVVFVGHYEDDDRIPCIEALIEAGIRFRLAGPGWHLTSSSAIRSLGHISPARGKKYAEYLCSAKLALTFFSKRNRDEYTRRCFEIPAMGVPLVSPKTPTMQNLFEEGSECAMFEGPKDLVSLCRHLLSDSGQRKLLGLRGRRRVYKSGYDVISVARQFIHEARVG